MLVALALGSGCRGVGTSPEPLRLAIDGAQNGHVAVAAQETRVVVTWAARGGDATDVYAAFSQDGGASFGAPIRVNDVAGDARASAEQAPRVALARGVDVVWNSRQDGASVVRAAASREGGTAFASAASIHPDGLKGARGWASVASGPDGALHVSWLDGRANAPVEGPAGARRSMRQDLFQSVRRADGTRDEVQVATDVCFCCKTTTAVGPDGAVYVAWRHIFPPNIRDIAVARSEDGGRTFGEPVRLSEDGWAIDACPDDGPSMAVDAANVVHVAWPTQVSPSAGKGIFYTSSRDRARSFAPRTRVDDESGQPAHPQLAVRGNGVAVVWDESVGGGARRVRLREVGANASLGPAETLSAGAAATYPAVAATGDALVVAWTQEAEKSSEVRVRRLSPTR